MATSRTAGAPAGAVTSTVNVTGCSATGSAGLAVRVIAIPGAGRTCTPIDAVCRRSTASRTVAVTM